MIFTGKEAEEKFRNIFGTEKDLEQLIDEGYEKCDQQEYNERQLGLINYGDETYYFTHKEEFEKDWKIAELEEEVLRLKEQLKNAIIPKFKIGQEIFIIEPKSLVIVKCVVVKIEIDNAIDYIAYKLYSVVLGKQWFYEDEIFATREEAEQRLKELKGE